MKIDLFNDFFLEISFREARQHRLKIIQNFPPKDRQSLLFFEFFPEILASLLAQTNKQQKRPLAVRFCCFARSALVSLLIKVRRRRLQIKKGSK